jgi:DNA-directed RNA polymerase subunit omega
MDIKSGFDSNYRYVLVAARRARQIENGSSPLIPSHSHKACRVAQDEIDAGKVSYVRKDSPRESLEPLPSEFRPIL